MKYDWRARAVMLALAAGAILSGALPAPANEETRRAPRDYPVQPVPFTAVHFNDAFWLPRIEVNRTVTIPFAFEKCEESKRVYHFERAAAVLRGETLTDKEPPGYPFDDTDVYKVIEGAAYTLSVKPDPEAGGVPRLSDREDRRRPGKGRLPLHDADHRSPAPSPLGGGRSAGSWRRWTATSSTTWATSTRRRWLTTRPPASAPSWTWPSGRRSCSTEPSGPGKQSIWPGHQITEMGLVKLYRVTGDPRYLSLAKFLLDERGPGERRRGAAASTTSRTQKVVDQSEAVGHAVRATYMYSGMADVAALTGEKPYVDAMDRIWGNVVGRKLYLTGGIGSTSSGEAFGIDYDLPNLSAYNETCAAIGNDYWNHRLFLLHADAKYIDVMERTLYNGLLSGVSLDGKSFFYPNPLESAGQHQRSPWFGVACCPGNMTRFLASVPGYVYAQQGDALYVNLFVASTAEVEDGRRPQGQARPGDSLSLGRRRPDHGEPGSGRPLRGQRARSPAGRAARRCRATSTASRTRRARRSTLRVNGQAVPVALEKGYARLDRSWKAGDVIELGLPMPVRRVAANASVDADEGRVALQRGPLVYAVEGPDNPGGKVRNLLARRRRRAHDRVPARPAERRPGDHRPRRRARERGRR